MDSPWTVYGQSMDVHAQRVGCPWIVNGLFMDCPMDCPCTVHGLSMGCPWTVHGQPMGIPWA
eukprot:1147345-Lingulodinium_polyedra.AAC.1